MGKIPGHDVVVVGAGIFGLSCAWACVREGWRVLLVDAGEPGCGASGGVVGVMSPYLPHGWNAKKQFQLDALIGAEVHWQQIEEVSGLNPGYERVGRWMPLNVLSSYNTSLRQIGGAAQAWPAGFNWQVEDAPSWIAPEATPYGAAFENLTARIHPRRAIEALVKALKTEGAEFRNNTHVRAVEPGMLHLNAGTIEAENIILAAGTGGHNLVTGLLEGPSGYGVKGQAALLKKPAGMATPALFLDGTYIVPHADGTVGVGSTSEKSWSEPIATDGLLDDLIAQVRRIYPLLNDAPEISRWAGVRPRAPRADPLIGPVPGARGIYVANGGFKTGIGLAHRIGQVVVDMMCARDAEFPLSFLPDGHGLTARR